MFEQILGTETAKKKVRLSRSVKICGSRIVFFFTIDKRQIGLICHLLWLPHNRGRRAYLTNLKIFGALIRFLISSQWLALIMLETLQRIAERRRVLTILIGERKYQRFQELDVRANFPLCNFIVKNIETQLSTYRRISLVLLEHKR